MVQMGLWKTEGVKGQLLQHEGLQVQETIQLKNLLANDDDEDDGNVDMDPADDNDDRGQDEHSVESHDEQTISTFEFESGFIVIKLLVLNILFCNLST